MTDREDAFAKAVAAGAFDGLVGGGPPKSVELPWPSTSLSPNARGHWGERARAVGRARKDAFILTRAKFKRKPKWQAVKLDVEFCPPDRRRYDDDNLIARFKASRDGIADALGIDDSAFEATYRIGAPVKGGMVRVTIQAAHEVAA